MIRALWRALPDELRTADRLPEFGRYIRDVHPHLLAGMTLDLRLHIETMLWGLY